MNELEMHVNEGQIPLSEVHKDKYYLRSKKDNSLFYREMLVWYLESQDTGDNSGRPTFHQKFTWSPFVVVYIIREVHL